MEVMLWPGTGQISEPWTSGIPASLNTGAHGPYSHASFPFFFFFKDLFQCFGRGEIQTVKY